MDAVIIPVTTGLRDALIVVDERLEGWKSTQLSDGEHYKPAVFATTSLAGSIFASAACAIDSRLARGEPTGARFDLSRVMGPLSDAARIVKNANKRLAYDASSFGPGDLLVSGVVDRMMRLYYATVDAIVDQASRDLGFAKLQGPRGLVEFAALLGNEAQRQGA